MTGTAEWSAVVGIVGAIAIAGCGDPSGDPDAAPAPDADLRYELLAPTGPHAIGTDLRLVTDPSRAELETADPNDRRRLLIQLWYPTDPAATGAAAAYMTTDEAAYITANTPALTEGWVDGIRFHARTGVPVVADGQRHPVLVVSHGLFNPRQYYTSLVEDAVSHGYVVAAMSHLYDSAPVELPDGTDLGYGLFLGAPLTQAGLDAHVAVWSADAGFVIDQLEALDAADPDGVVTGRLDLTRIGMYGHSYGGAAAADLAVLDARLDAGIDLDGTIFGDTADGAPAISIPYMIMRSHVDASYPPVWAALTVGYDVSLAGAGHSSYSDLGLLLQSVGATLDPGSFGTIDPARAITIIRAYVLAFFDKHLRGQDPVLLDGSPDPYNETTVVRKP